MLSYLWQRALSHLGFPGEIDSTPSFPSTISPSSTLSSFPSQSPDMAVDCPQFSYTKPKRLPKQRCRPSNAAFRVAAAQLDLISRKAGGIRKPAIVDLSEGEPSPEVEYEMVEYAVQ
jgi:hypothetical protein